MGGEGGEGREGCRNKTRRARARLVPPPPTCGIFPSGNPERRATVALVLAVVPVNAIDYCYLLLLSLLPFAVVEAWLCSQSQSLRSHKDCPPEVQRAEKCPFDLHMETYLGIVQVA